MYTETPGLPGPEKLGRNRGDANHQVRTWICCRGGTDRVTYDGTERGRERGSLSELGPVMGLATHNHAES